LKFAIAKVADLVRLRNMEGSFFKSRTGESPQYLGRLRIKRLASKTCWALPKRRKKVYDCKM